jgi:hypothetical protein
VQGHVTRERPRETVTRAMALLRKGTCSWTAPLDFLGVEVEEEVLLATVGDLE